MLFERLHVRYGAMLMSATYVVAMVLLLFANTFFLAVVFAIFYGIAVGAGYIVENLLWADYFGRTNLGAIRGYGAPFRLLSPLGPALTGVVYDLTGSYVIPFTTFAMLFSLLVAAMYMAKPPVKPGTAEASS